MDFIVGSIALTGFITGAFLIAEIITLNIQFLKKRNEISLNEINSNKACRDETADVTQKSKEDDLTTLFELDLQKNFALIRFKVYNNASSDRVVPLCHDVTIIGRDIKSQKSEYCTINDPYVSRIHATILKENKQLYIVDEWAKNGTYINDHRIPPHKKIPIPENADISLGNTSFTIEMIE